MDFVLGLFGMNRMRVFVKLPGAGEERRALQVSASASWEDFSRLACERLGIARCARVLLGDDDVLHEVDDLQYLAAVNMTPAAIAKRELREVFRAFAVCGSLVCHHYEEDRMFTVPDGTHQETSTDSEGNTTTRTVQDYSNINVHLTFNAGKIVIRSEDDSNIWSAGFAPSLNYHDGHGSAIKPRTGEVFHATNEAASLGSEQLGYSAGHGDFTLTGGLPYHGGPGSNCARARSGSRSLHL